MKRLLFATILASFVLDGRAFGAGFLINNLDGANEGFNDPTFVAASDIDGQPTTLGQERLDCFAAAAQVWANLLATNITIEVDANFDSLGGNQFGAPLGAAGFETIHSDYTGRPIANMWFSVAEANQHFGGDLNGATAEIGSVFNSDLDEGTVLGGTTWYYGTDGNVPANHIDFFSTALHELGHGLGFATVMNAMNGALSGNRMDIYTNQLRRAGTTNLNYSAMSNAQRQAANTSGEVVWKGAAVVAEQGGNEPIYAPNPLESGSSISHWDTSAAPDLLMEPFATIAFTDVTLERQAFEDLFWPFAADPLDPDNVFVDAAFSGVESGAQANPFNTVGEAIDAANPNADINIEPGSYNETFDGGGAISKALTLRNNNPGGGMVTIGN